MEASGLSHLFNLVTKHSPVLNTFGYSITVYTMSDRKLLKEADPLAFETMLAFERYLNNTSLSRTVRDLIKIRASQINGCSYCLNKHIHEALKAGEHPRRIYLLEVWKETSLFTAEEQAILALTEEMTLIHQHGVSDTVYNNALNLIGQKHLTEAMMAIIAMNAWNRVGITTGRKPE